MEEMYLADAHAHISSEEVFHEVPLSFVNIIGYAIPDLVSAGMSKEVVRNISVGCKELHVSYGEGLLPKGPAMSEQEKWQEVKPYWKFPELQKMTYKEI